jgi:hypothetical protein
MEFNLDLRFFSDLRKGFIALGKPKRIPLINHLSIWGLVLGSVLIILSMFYQGY